ncbi:exopolysaccharide production repressor protein [Mesorhizobium australicum]|uniref:exopolysaccharide production repressor protein n=1 Tax=Mesorhizobium australicum TaxID=536018 RepID=UPI0033367230
MYFPRFLVGVTAALTILFIWIYNATGLVLDSLIWTAIAAFMLQLGYFLALGFLVFRSDVAKSEQSSVSDEEERANLFGGTGSLFH